MQSKDNEILFYNEQAIEILNPMGGAERYETESITNYEKIKPEVYDQEVIKILPKMVEKR